MTPTDLAEHVNKVFTECLDTLKKKNADYSSSDSNAFRNFEMVELFGIANVGEGIMVRLSDKYARIANLLKKDPDVIGESIQDSIEDAINYLAILHAYLQAGKNKKHGK